MQHPDATPIPAGSRLEKANDYLRIVNAHGHILATYSGSMPYHRYVCFEAIGRPRQSACVHCGYVLPWKTTLTPAQPHVVNVDHLDNDKSNNDPANLAPSCSWCNANRSWAEKSSDFWAKWKKWMADIHPMNRPNLALIAPDFGVKSPFTDIQKSTDISTDMSVNGHTDKRPYTYTAASVRWCCDSVADTDRAKIRRLEKIFELAQSILKPGQSMTWKELVAALQEARRDPWGMAAGNSALRWINAMRDANIIVPEFGAYRLNPTYCIRAA